MAQWGNQGPNMEPLQKLNAQFDAADTNGNGSIDKSELGTVLRKSGVKFSKAELLQMFDHMDLSTDGVISRAEFVSFFSRHLSVQANSKKYNRLLLKSTIGNSKASSYDLPGDYHRYGRELKRDNEGAGNVIFNWTSFQPTSTVTRKLNVVKMNKNAVTKGKMTSVKDINAYNKTHKIYDAKQMTGSRSRKELLNRFKHRPELHDRIYGVTNESDVPIRDLINGKFNPYTQKDAKEAMYPSNTAKDNRARRKANAQKFDRMKPTKASLGHAMARRRLEAERAQKEKPKFMMKRFAKVNGRLARGGAGVVTGGGF